MKTDLHIHSNYSSDSKATPEEIIEKAMAASIEVIAITDHADFAKGDSCFAQAPYLQHLQTLRQQHRELTILCGVELGLQAEHANSCAAFPAGHDFDFVIGSMHRARELDFYNGEFFTSHSVDQCWEIYLKETLRAVKSCPDFDVLGHLDIIRRYNITRNSQPPASAWPIIEELFAWLVAHNKGIEINTSGLRYGLDSVHPTMPLLQCYKKMGGRIVTIGSDSHNVTTMGQDFDLAVDMLKECGFTHLAWFINRQAKFAEI